LLYYEQAVHRHLDWRPLLDWLGHAPFGVLEENGVIQAALACPSDPPEIAWIRLFAVGSGLHPKEAWKQLWQFVMEQGFEGQDPVPIGAIPLNGWFQSLLEESGFKRHNEVVVLIWEVDDPRQPMGGSFFRIRSMVKTDLPQVAWVDQQSFPSPWQISEKGLRAGFEQAFMAVVAENADGILAYQISTAMNDSAHLARLAVLPAYQKRGIGATLVKDLQAHCFRQGLRSLTVNTQADNLASLRLYSKLDFHPTGEKYPLYLFER
jgi:ribosomal-protein-alanine N-acetyltransferase